MRLTGTHRPTPADGHQPDHDPVTIEAAGADYAQARDALHTQVPDGHQLLTIRRTD